MYYIKKDNVIKDDDRTIRLMNILVLVALSIISAQFLPIGLKNKGPPDSLKEIENKSMNNVG